MTELSRSVWLAGAIELAFASGLLAQLGSGKTVDELLATPAMPPRIARTLLDVLVASGFVLRDGDRFVAAVGVAALTARGAGRFVAARLHSSLGQMHGLARGIEASQVSEGWAQEADVIRAQGLVSEAVTLGAMPQMMRHLPAAQKRLSSPGAAFLDVGSGAAGACIAMCALFPELRVVGLEPSAGPMAEGRKVVAASPHADRITLRARGLETLEDADCYAAAYVAQMFFPDAVIVDGMARVLRSLEPGGVVLTGSVYASGDDLAAAMGRFTSTVWGGGTRSAEDVAAILRQTGFIDVFIPPAQVGMTPVVGRKPMCDDRPAKAL